MLLLLALAACIQLPFQISKRIFKIQVAHVLTVEMSIKHSWLLEYVYRCSIQKAFSKFSFLIFQNVYHFQTSKMHFWKLAYRFFKCRQYIPPSSPKAFLKCRLQVNCGDVNSQISINQFWILILSLQLHFQIFKSFFKTQVAH